MTFEPFGPPAQAPPPEVPGYVVHEILGFGSHGEVWLGEDVVSGERVALKIGRPPDGELADGDALERELALLSRIVDDHVVGLRGVVRLADGGHALVLEYAAGGNLGTLVVARGALEPAEVTTLLVPLGQALERLHGRGLVHGDLSPGNVLLAGDGRPLLSDLGVSRVLGARQATPPGTPGFADPALARGVDPRSSDVWGLAAIGWFALTGRPPGEVYDGPARLEAPALTRLLAEVLGADPPERPSPGELAHRAWSAVPPAPIRLVTTSGPADESTWRTLRSPSPPPLPEPVEPPASRRLRRRPSTPPSAGPPEDAAGPAPGWPQGTPVAGPAPARGPRTGVAAAMTAASARPRPAPPPVRRRRPPDAAGGRRSPDAAARRPSDDAAARRPSDDAAGRPSDGAAARYPSGGAAGRPSDGAAGRYPPDAAAGPPLRPRLASHDNAGGAGRPRPPSRDGAERPMRPRPPSGDGAGRPRRLRRGVVVAALVLTVAAAGGTAVRLSTTSTPPAGSGAERVRTASREVGPPDPAAALRAIARARAQAFASASTAHLAAADEPGSAAMAADAAVVRALADRGWRLAGVTYAVGDVRVVRHGAGTATVVSRVTTSAHRRVTAGGTVLSHVPAEGPRQVTLTLVAVPGSGWRVRAVS